MNAQVNKRFINYVTQFSIHFKLAKKTISTNFPLAEALPRNFRRKNKMKLERYLSFKLNIGRPPLFYGIHF